MIPEIRSRIHPHEVLWMAATALSGIANFMFFNVLATPVVKAMPFPLGHILYLGISLCSASTLVGIYWKGSKIAGAVIQRVGLVVLTSYGITYAVIVLGYSGVHGISFSGIMAGLATANLVRVQQIGQEIKAMQAARMMLKEDE